MWGQGGQGLSHLKEYSAVTLSHRKRKEDDMRIQILGVVLLMMKREKDVYN